MLARQRQRLILNMLENSPSLRTIELAKYFDVTDETIRRDLETLDAENKLIRTHGGALRIEKRSAELPLQKRLNENRAAKQEIAKKAIGLVSPSDTIFLDASSTVLTFAESLPDIKITVITNAHDCVVPLMSKGNIDVITTGGKLDRVSHSYCGISALSLMKRFSIDKAFFSCNGRKRSSRNTRRVQRKFAVNLPRKNPPLRLLKIRRSEPAFFLRHKLYRHCNNRFCRRPRLSRQAAQIRNQRHLIEA